MAGDLRRGDGVRLLGQVVAEDLEAAAWLADTDHNEAVLGVKAYLEP
jgi:hypothetical protein